MGRGGVEAEVGESVGTTLGWVGLEAETTGSESGKQIASTPLALLQILLALLVDAFGEPALFLVAVVQDSASVQVPVVFAPKILGSGATGQCLPKPSAVSVAAVAVVGFLLGGLGTGLGQSLVVRPGPVLLLGQHGGGGRLPVPFEVGGWGCPCSLVGSSFFPFVLTGVELGCSSSIASSSS